MAEDRLHERRVDLTDAGWEGDAGLKQGKRFRRVDGWILQNANNAPLRYIAVFTSYSGPF